MRVSTLTLGEGVLVETFGVLRACGQNRTECVVYWVGPREDRDVDEVVHPTHSASTVHYEVDGDWITAFFVRLLGDQRSVKAQVHTHPGRADHSLTDDGFALAPSEGFLSLVVPRFAQGPVQLEGTVLVEMVEGGGWEHRDPVCSIG